MTASELSPRLSQWWCEFASLAGAEVAVPEKFWPFLAQRLVELGVAEDDPDVVLAKVGDSYRKVRITGLRGALLVYEQLGGGVGYGVIPRDAVHRESLGKLSDILNRFERDGKARSA